MVHSVIELVEYIGYRAIKYVNRPRDCMPFFTTNITRNDQLFWWGGTLIRAAWSSFCCWWYTSHSAYPTHVSASCMSGKPSSSCCTTSHRCEPWHSSQHYRRCLDRTSWISFRCGDRHQNIRRRCTRPHTGASERVPNDNTPHIIVIIAVVIAIVVVIKLLAYGQESS